jgi:sugar phosphate permease
VLYLGRFLVSLGVSIIFVSMLKLQTEWFPSKRFARMTATGFFVANAGTIIGTTPLALLITVAGWRLSFEIVGIITLVICLACWFIIKNRPSDIGLPSPAEIEGASPASSIRPASSEDVLHFGKRVLTVLKNKYIWPPFIIGVGLYGTMLVLQGAWGIPYLMQVYSMTRDAAANVLLMIVVGHLTGIVIIPYLSDRMQRRKLPTVVSTLCYLVVWILIVSLNNGKPPVAALYPLLFFLGFFVGVGAVYFAVAKEVVPPYISGMALGLVNMGMFVSIALFQILVGKMLDLGWLGMMVEGARVYPQEAFQSGFILVCVGVLPAVIGALLLKETRCRDLYNELYK